jgi:hypothetical protein
LRQEPHVSHLVGLVEHADLYPVEPAVTAMDKVVETARGSDHDVGAAAQRVGLSSE